MKEQLIKKDCQSKEYSNIYPITSLQSVIDPETGKSLDLIIESCNHYYLPFKDNRRSSTRLQVPSSLRRTGLFITYESCKGEVITEYYNYDDFSDRFWSCGDNWVRVFDKNMAEALVKSIYSWYKA